jgi:hypothetical protein
LSHTSTVAVVFVATLATAALFVVRGRGALTSAAAAVVIASVVAALIAIVVYYAQFADTYRSELARIAHETTTNAADAGNRTMGDRLRGVPYALGLNFGWPVVILAVLGAARIFRRQRDRLALTVAGWTAACALFLAIGILTPVDLRYYLAAVPVFAIAAADGGAWAIRDAPAKYKPLWLAGGALLLGAAITTGIRTWLSALG